MSAIRVGAVLCTALLVAACSGADERANEDTAGLPRFTPPPSAAPEAPESEPAELDRIVGAYHAYTAAVTDALAAGDADVPQLRAVAVGRALKDARARVRANRRDGVVTTGELEPSATVADVEWSGGDRATVSDCVLNGLEQVDAEDAGRVVAEASGTRRPVEAQLSRTSDGWVVSDVEMVFQDPADRGEKDPPYLRGPMPDGPPSCAPPDVAQEVLARYGEFWDAFDRAFGFGRDGPADPDDPGLAGTSVDPQLSDAREFLAELRDKNQTSRGERNVRDPWVLGLTDFDRTAFVGDCVTLGDSQTVDLDTGNVIERNTAGQVNLYNTEMVRTGNVWNVRNWDVTAEGVRNCVPQG